MKKDWLSCVRIYSWILILLGVVGYVSNPDKAITSLILATGVGLLLYVITSLPKNLVQNKRGAIALGLFLFLYGTAVTVRALIGWVSWKAGIDGKLFPSLLLTAISFFNFTTLYFVVNSCPLMQKNKRN